MQIFDAANYSFNPHAIPMFLTGAAVLFLGLLVLIHERVSRLSVLFLLLTAAIGVWLLGMSLAYCSIEKTAALWWIRGAHWGVTFIPPAIYHFTVAALGSREQPKKYVWLSWSASIVFFTAVIKTDLFISGVNSYEWGYYAKYAWLSLPFLLFFFAVMIATLRRYWTAYRMAAPGADKKRNKWFLTAFSIGYLGSLDFVGAYGVPLYPFGYLAIIGFIVLTARAIWRYRLGEITPAIAANEILNAVADALFVFDHVGILRVANKAACRLLGKTEDEVTGTSIKEICCALSAPEELASMLLSGAARDYELNVPATQGETCVLSLSSFATRAKNHDPAAIVCVARNITERKQAERQIQRHRERQATLYNLNLATTSTLDLQSLLDILLEKITPLLPDRAAAGVWLANRETGALEPVAARNLDEKTWKTKKAHPKRGLASIVYESDAPLMSRNAQTDPRTRDPEFFRAHGLVSYLGVPLTAKGDNLGIISFFTKTEYEFSREEIEFFSTLAGQAAIAIHNSQLYEQTKKQAAELREANRVKDEFLSFMSHELRTPIATIMGYTRMVQTEMLGTIREEQAQALGKVTKNSNELLTMINSIMEATKIEAGVSKADNYKVNLVEFLDELKSFYLFPLGKELTLEWDYPQDLPVLHTDGAKLKHVLQNLIINAIKFTEKGQVVVSVRHRPETRTVEFKVSDTGIGIPQEALSVIFDRFRQVDSSERRVYGGVGLGLHIVKKFTEMLGGTIEVASERGKGSTFTVRLPLIPG